MKYLLSFIFILQLLCAGECVFSQSMREAFDVPLELLQRVNSIEGFIKRFNYQEDLNGNRIPEMVMNEECMEKRNRYILSLFDYEKLHHTDSTGKFKIQEFLNKVNNKEQPFKLDFYDQRWYAEVKMDVLYRKLPQQLTLVLVNEQTHPKISHWAIKAVKADFLDLYPNQTRNDTAHIIPPNSHGTDFIGITQQFSNHAMIKNYTSSTFKPDILSIFVYASQNGEIEFKNARDISYHFLQISDWIVKVKELNRNNANSGWLVSELIRADNQNKFQYESQILNIHNP